MRRRPLLALAGIVTALVVLCLVASLVLLTIPGAGARGADILRGLLGDRVTAGFETLVLGLQDQLQHAKYALGLGASLGNSTSVAAETTDPPAPSLPTLTITQGVGGRVSPPPTAPPPPWQPASVAVAKRGDGVWSPYILDAQLQPLAYRCVIHPDLDRPYAVVALAAIDLERARLHFVLGTKDPVSSVDVPRPGRIPDADRQPGVLLAAFNGGFQARHGHFGVMVGGTLVIAPRPRMATIGMAKDGGVRIGAWGQDFSPAGLVAWRQNGPLLVQNGQVNPHTADTAPEDWGWTVSGGTATWRSGVGISADSRTLYYAAGPSLTLPALARALAAAGAAQALQLDINHDWTHFDAIEPGKTGLRTVLLLQQMDDDARYLDTYKRDFFYLTAAQPVSGAAERAPAG